MDKKDNFYPKITVVAALLFVVFNFGVCFGFVKKIWSVTEPIFIGIVAALVLSVPEDFFYHKLFAKIKKEKVRKFLSLSLTFLLCGGVIALLGVLVIPQSIQSVRDICSMLSGDNAWNQLGEQNEFVSLVLQWGKKAYLILTEKLAEYFPKIVVYVKGFFSGVYNVVFGCFIAVMLLVGKNSVKRQFIKTADLILPEKKKNNLLFFLRKIISKFSKYLGGQVTEAFILGTVCYVVMLLLKVPYPALTGLIIGFVNLIPIVGAYLGGTVCCVLIFAVSPTKALVFLIAVVILQQVESFTTYPVIVGKYVGLSGFWITVSVLVWGGLFGFWGLFLGVPFTAVVQDILRAKSKKGGNLLPQELK